MKEWYKSKTLVRSIADGGDKINHEQGQPTARTTKQTGKTKAMRLSGFVFLMQKFLGNAVYDLA